MDQTELVAHYVVRCRSSGEEDAVELADEILDAASHGRIRKDQAADLLTILREETGVQLFLKEIH